MHERVGTSKYSFARQSILDTHTESNDVVHVTSSHPGKGVHGVQGPPKGALYDLERKEEEKNSVCF